MQCKKCGYCCQWLTFYYKPHAELTKFLEARGFKKVQGTDKLEEWKLYSPCPHYLSNWGCKTYGSRPETCRAFPVVTKEHVTAGMDYTNSIPEKCGYYESVKNIQDKYKKEIT